MFGGALDAAGQVGGVAQGAVLELGRRADVADSGKAAVDADAQIHGSFEASVPFLVQGRQMVEHFKCGLAGALGVVGLIGRRADMAMISSPM